MAFERRDRLLWIVPIATLVLSVLLVNCLGPYSQALYVDPEYVYLLNSLSFLTFNTPGHVDHPGTTVQLVGAIVLLFKWLGGGLAGHWETLPMTVLSHPEDFLHAINLALNLLIAIAMYSAARAAYRVSGSIIAALVLQLSLFLFSENLISLPRVTPEPLMIAALFGLAVPLITWILRHEDVESGLAPAIAAGILLGFGVVTKITFLPVSALILVFEGWKRKFLFGLAALGSILVFTFPIWPKLQPIMTWFWALLTHSGDYGSGAKGLPEASILAANTQNLFKAQPYLFYFLTFYVAALAAVWLTTRGKRTPLASRAMTLLLAVVVSMAVQIAITVKHYNPRYALPAFLIPAVANAFLVVLVQSSVLRRTVSVSIAVAGSILALFALRHSSHAMKDWVNGAQGYQERIAGLAGKWQSAPDCALVSYYRSSLPGYGLAFAAGYTEGQYGQLLERLYPRQFFYHHRSAAVISFSGEARRPQLLRLLAEGGCAFLEGHKETVPIRAAAFSGMTVEPVAETQEEVLLRLTGGTAKLAANLDLSAASVVIEAEKFDGGNAEYLDYESGKTGRSQQKQLPVELSNDFGWEDWSHKSRKMHSRWLGPGSEVRIFNSGARRAASVKMQLCKHIKPRNVRLASAGGVRTKFVLVERDVWALGDTVEFLVPLAPGGNAFRLESDQPSDVTIGGKPAFFVLIGEVDARPTKGNVVADASVPGLGIGGAASPKFPARAEYNVALTRAGRFRLWIRYASQDERPLVLSLNGRTFPDPVCAEATGGYGPPDQQWFDAGSLDFVAGRNVIRLESKGPFPHIDKLALMPAKRSTSAAPAK